MIERNTYFYALFLMEAYMNLEKIKKFFGFPLDKKHKDNVEKELCNYLYHTGKIICIIIVISQIIMMISISAREGGPCVTYI